MSFQVAEEGLSHQFPMPEAPAPETLKSEQELGQLLGDQVPEKLRDVLTRDRPIEILPVTPGNPLKPEDRKSTRLNSSHVRISYAVFCLKKKKKTQTTRRSRR